MSYQTSSKMPRPFWLLIGARKLLCFPAQSEGSSLWVVSCVLTRNDTWKVPILAQNVRDIVRSLGENLTGKHAGPFAGVITVAYLKVCENIHRFTDVFWIQGDISLGFKIRQAWCGGESTRVPPFLYRYRSCAYAICGCWGSCWFSPLLREVFLWVLRSVPLSLKTNISKFQFNQESSRWRTTNRSGCATSKSLLINLFKCRSVLGLMIYAGSSSDNIWDTSWLCDTHRKE